VVEEAFGRSHTDAHIPALCDVEIAAILRRAILRHELSEGRAADAVIDLLDLPLIRHGHMGLLGRILRLRENFSAYHASYVALAEQLDASLLTADAALVRAVRTHLRLPVVDASGAA
jgi:predicted nucleic acid-binding protein